VVAEDPLLVREWVTVVLLSTYAADDLPADCGAVAYLRRQDLAPSALHALVTS